MPLAKMLYRYPMQGVGQLELVLEGEQAPLQLIVTINVADCPVKREALRHPDTIHPNLQLVKATDHQYTYYIRRHHAAWCGSDITLRTMPIFDSVLKVVVAWLMGELARPLLQPQ